MTRRLPNNLKLLGDEKFEEKNCASEAIWQKKKKLKFKFDFEKSSFLRNFNVRRKF